MTSDAPSSPQARYSRRHRDSVKAKLEDIQRELQALHATLAALAAERRRPEHQEQPRC